MVSNAEIEAAKTKKGAWTRATLESWGVSWPPRRGWRKRVLNGLPPLENPPVSKSARRKVREGRVEWMMAQMGLHGEIDELVLEAIALRLGFPLAGRNLTKKLNYVSREIAKRTTGYPAPKKIKAKIFNAERYDADHVTIVPPRPIIPFYETEEWRKVRYQALKLHGAICQCCGARSGPGRPIHVDHIKPRSKFPELELDISNLQVLCKDCNFGKSAWDQTDWRPR